MVVGPFLSVSFYLLIRDAYHEGLMGHSIVGPLR